MFYSRTLADDSGLKKPGFLPKFLATRKPKKPGFLPNLLAAMRLLSKNPVSGPVVIAKQEGRAYCPPFLLDIILISELNFQYPQGNSNPRRIRERDVS
jgi:hypothetical protein